VRFRLGTAAACFEGQALTLASGDRVDADFVLVGIGVRPRTDIAEAAGIAGEGCVPVDGFLETCHSGVFAAGDIAQYPDPLSGEPMRIEHWVTAERQGQVAAANMLGYERRFAAVPFFWTEQFGVALRYVGHGVRWDEVQVEGDIEGADFIARYYDQGAHCASAAVGRDLAILEDERRFERRIADALSKHREPRTRSGIECATVKVEAGRGS
jgi:NADPH-dependent 2,4-dienoyl-CoA reductase/sulfur reductase-like enzyme